MNFNLNLILTQEEKEYFGINPENHVYGFTAYLAETVAVSQRFLVQMPAGLSSGELIDRVAEEYHFDIFDVLLDISTEETTSGIVSYYRTDVSKLLTKCNSLSDLYEKAIFLNFG